MNTGYDFITPARPFAPGRAAIRTGAALLLAASFALAGCASSGGAERDRADRHAISAEELGAVQSGDLYQAVERLRARWLQVRGSRSFERESVIMVYREQTRLGGPDVLRGMPRGAAVWLEYLDGTTASASLPGIARGVHIQGAIIVHTRSREEPGERSLDAQ